MDTLSVITRALEAVDASHCALSSLTYNTARAAPKAGKYLERPFAYEFYHQLRTLMSASFDAWTTQLQGEVDKRYQGIPLIPDFLIHRPNSATANVAVIQFKMAQRGWEELATDLRKLAQFSLNPLTYETLVEVVIGFGNDLLLLQSHLAEIETPQGPAVTILWYELPMGRVSSSAVTVLPGVTA